MPFRSMAQRNFLYSKHPGIAKRFEAHSPKNVKLPYHVGKGDKSGPLKKMFGGSDKEPKEKDK